jgi:hypothetical protein
MGIAAAGETCERSEAGNERRPNVKGYGTDGWMDGSALGSARLVGHARGNGRCSDAPRLRAHDDALACCPALHPTGHPPTLSQHTTTDAQTHTHAYTHARTRTHAHTHNARTLTLTRMHTYAHVRAQPPYDH